MEYKEILEDEINKLNKAMKNLDSINVIDYNTIVMKKNMQKRINKGYSLIIDVRSNSGGYLTSVTENQVYADDFNVKEYYRLKSGFGNGKSLYSSTEL